MEERDVFLHGSGERWQTATIAVIAILAIAVIVAIALWEPWSSTRGNSITIIEQPAATSAAVASGGTSH